MPVPLTVVIPTLNEERQIAAALEALRWADEVIVADGGSSDRTAELARSHGAAVIEVRGESIGLQRNAAIARARSEEHTSELQSPCNLVCRLLLEKKKKKKKNNSWQLRQKRSDK